MRLNREFFQQKTLKVAKDLLGKYLVRKINGRIIRAKIIETEAYCGPKDLACHASKGRTPRTEVMFGNAGYAYVYLIYGMYHCLNVVSEKENYPAAVLIRGAEILNDQKSLKFRNSNLVLKLNGPGKLCRALKIDKKLNKEDLITSNKLWIEYSGEKVPGIKKTKRIGIDYAGEYKDKLWRFMI